MLLKSLKETRMNKRAISAVVAEVLMIGMALVMAGAVYSFLKFYVSKPLPTESCPDGIALIISDYKCYKDTVSGDSFMNITFKNQGRFDIEGVSVRINNDTSNDIAIYLLHESVFSEDAGKNIESPFNQITFNPVLAPGESQKKIFIYTNYNKLRLIETEPIKGTDNYGRSILCEKATSRMSINC